MVESKPNPSLNLHILIMAGGSGTRFWPKSRRGKPKQLLALWDDRSLLEHTVERFLPLVPVENIWIVTTQELVEPSKAALGRLANGIRFLGEPSAKNTAPCILWGVSEIAKVDPQAVVAVMPADHYIEDENRFREAVTAAVEDAKESGGIVTLGIRPNRPETGYGYIETDKGAVPGKPQLVKRFVEKPDLRTANRYIESGVFLWNAGMFLFRVDVALKAFQQCMPELSERFERAEPISAIYGSIDAKDAVSFDYGVMEAAVEKGIRVAVLAADCGWNDVGSFTALEDIGRAVLGKLVVHDSASNVVQTDSGIVALLGVSDLVVVRDRDVVLVAAKDRAQDIKVLLEKVRQKAPETL